MKFKIIRSKFLDALKKVQNIVAGKGALQIIQNVLVEAKDGKLNLTTTDLDVSIRSSVACEVAVEGSTTLPVKLLFNTVSSVADGMLEVEIDASDRATVTAGSATFEIAGMNSVDFPALPKDNATFAYTLPQLTLREMLRKTSYAVSQDETRKTLKGVLMSFKNQKVTMVATDGRRLALVDHEIEFPAEVERDVILPPKVVSELQRSLAVSGDVQITIEKTQISFNLGDTRIYSKLLDEIYPNYLQVIPKELTERVTVDRKLLMNAIDRARVMSIDEVCSTRFTFANNELIVSAATTDIGKARDIVPIKYAGEPIDIIFNPNYVMDPLKAIDEDEVLIELNSGSTPAIMRCSVPFLYVMMPLRIN